MIGNKTRKVKFTFLLLNTWLADGSFGINLPLDIVNAPDNYYCYYSNCQTGKPSFLKILIQPSPAFDLRKITKNEISDLSFDNYSDSLFKDYRSLVLNNADFTSNINLKFISKNLKNGVFLNTTSSGNDEGYYQMVVLPGKALNLPIKRKTVFLIDFDITKSRIPAQDVYSNLKKYIDNNYTEKDSFAIFFAGFTVTGTGNYWVRGDSISKQNAFKNISASSIKEYSNLTSIISKGADFVSTNKGGDLILIVASEHGYSPTNSNSIINDYISTLPKGSKFSTIDLGSYSNGYYSNVYFYGDGYLYSNLARLTKGLFSSLYDYNYVNYYIPYYNDMLDKAVQNSSGLFTSLETYTTLLNGFCSGRTNFSNNTLTPSFSSPIIQVGKYNGSLPFIIQMSGVYNGKTFNKNFSVGENEISQSDSNTRLIYEGKYILDREASQQSNFTISDIIDHSLKNRVLSNYTAFLALEPSQGGKICSTCPANDESKALGLGEELNTIDSLILSVFPSPVVKDAKVVIKDYLYSPSSKISIYNSMGILVKNIDLSLVTSSRGRVQIDLGVENDELMANGTYFLIYTNGSRVKKSKFVVQK